MAKVRKLRLIEKGVVIDHIKAWKAFDVLKALRVPKKYSVSILINVPSRKIKRKDIIKIEQYIADAKKLAKKIMKIAPKATINIIKNRKVVEKLRIPEFKKVLKK